MPKKNPSSDSSPLVDAAKTIGTVAGKVASLLGVQPDAKPARKLSKGKFVKKTKSRLPRKEKKALLKRPASQQS